MNEHPRAALARLSDQLLHPEAGYGSMLEAVEALFALFSDLASLDADAAEARQHRHLPTGKAIGTLWAGMCLKEILRTRRFLLGIHNALTVLAQRFLERPLRMAYAGTGPFATLALPLIGRWAPEQVQFVFMDINPESLRCLQHVVDRLDAGAWVEEMVCCDATQYRFASGCEPHLIVSETMLHALKNEPQVAITMNLVPQVVPGGIFIPQNIVVDAALFHNGRWFENMHSLDAPQVCVQRVGTAFQLDTLQMPVPERADGTQAWFPQMQVAVPQVREAGFDQLQLFTDIQVFDDVWLRDWDCSLNIPEPVLDQLPDGAFDLRFHYEISNQPGIRWSLASA